MKKIAMCVGINKYPNPANCLRGCVPDALGFTKYLKEKKGFMVETILDEHATLEKITSALRKNIGLCEPGDVFVWTSSSHGSQVPDRNGDEIDGRDEVICMYNGNLTDDVIRSILNTAKPGVGLVFVSDSCFSGTTSRAMVNTHEGVHYKKPRFIEPWDAKFCATAHTLPLHKRMFRSPVAEEQMNEILISGCSDKQYSADAYFNGSYYGALTYHLLDILNNATIDLTYNQLYAALRSRLPSSNYDQIPQLEGSTINKNRIIFT